MPSPNRFAFMLLVLLCLGAAHRATAQPQDKSGAARWTVDDILKQEALRDVAIAPGGERVLWVKQTPDFEKDRATTDLYLSFVGEADSAEAIRLTRTGNNADPQWSPDAGKIAFASTREAEDRKGKQIWLLDPRGGAPRPLTKLENGIEAFAWLDASRLLVAAREDKRHYETARKEKKDDARAVEDTTEFYAVRLFTVETGTGKTQRLTRNEGRINAFAADPSGRYVVYGLRSSPITADARNQPQQYLLDVETGDAEEIFAETFFDPSSFTWELDGSGFYATDERSSDPENEGAGITELFHYELSTGAYTKVPLGWPNGIGYGGYDVTASGVHVQLADGPRMKPRFYRKDGSSWSPADVPDERLRHTTSLDIGPDGETMVFDTSRPDERPAYLVGRYREGAVESVRQLTQLNSYLEKKPMPKAEVIEWAGAEGDTVNGILYYPLGYEEGRRYPLMTVIHGGPSGVDLDAWRLSWTVYPGLWAQRGAFVFRPNYHGSGHHGLDFVESIKGRYYELEVPDIVSGVERLIEEGKVDRDSLGVMGWSNGAILSIALMTEHPGMFKSAAPGAGDVNWVSDYGNCAFGVRFDDSYFGGAPWENLDHYIEKSPLFKMDRVVTPTLIQFGENDRAVPTEQGWQHYRALQQIGKAPVRFILYPEEGHGLARLSHQRRKVEEDLAWFDTHLFGEASMEERVAARALPEDAPLRRVEERAAIARAGAHYGAKAGGVLVPETVLLGDTLRVGRFEVTRMQWAAFQPEAAPRPGFEEYPARGVSFEEAQQYVAWLQEKTGRSYRLPTAAEAEALAEGAGASENNLAYWAGYPPTPNERALLEKRMQDLDPDALLMPVGSRPPASAHPNKTLLFDTNGNVAEWATEADGSGAPKGASATTLQDERSAETVAPSPAYVGLRVVLAE